MSLILSLIVLGVLFYLIQVIPLADPIPKILRLVLILLAIGLVMQAFGIPLGIPTFR